MLRSFDKFRLIMGYFDAEDLRRCRAFVSQFRPSWKEQAEFRVLRDSHAKLLVFQTMPLTAIVTSSNILSRAYETAVVVRGRPAKFFASAFDDFWARSELIKPLDLEVLKKTLETGVFEDRRESIIPDPSNQKPATRR